MKVGSRHKCENAERSMNELTAFPGLRKKNARPLGSCLPLCSLNYACVCDSLFSLPRRLEGCVCHTGNARPDLGMLPVIELRGAWPLGLCSSLCHLNYSITYLIFLLLSYYHRTLGKLKELGGARENFPPGNNE